MTNRYDEDGATDAATEARAELEALASRALPERAGRWAGESDRDVYLTVLRALEPGYTPPEDASDAYLAGRFRHVTRRFSGKRKDSREPSAPTIPLPPWMQPTSIHHSHKWQGWAPAADRPTAHTMLDPTGDAVARSVAPELPGWLQPLTASLQTPADAEALLEAWERVRAERDVADWQKPLSHSIAPSAEEKYARSRLPAWMRPLSISTQTAAQLLARRSSSRL